MHLWVLFVHANDQLIGKVFIMVDDLHLHIFKWSQIARLFRFQIRCVKPPVLISSNILDIHDMAVFCRPEKKKNQPNCIPRKKIIKLTTTAPHPDTVHTTYKGQE